MKSSAVMAKRLIPCGNRLIVRREEPESMTKGGVILPGNAQQKSHRAVVVDMGVGLFTDDGVWKPILAIRNPCGHDSQGEEQLMTSQIDVGDVVILATWGGTEIEHDGEKLLIVNADDVLAIEKEYE